MNREPFFKRGEHWVWLQAGAVSICLMMVIGLIGLIAYEGFRHFWPSNVYMWSLKGDALPVSNVAGIIREKREGKVGNETELTEQLLLQVGNRDVYGSDFAWIRSQDVLEQTAPKSLVMVERREWGVLLGFLKGMVVDGKRIVFAEPDAKHLQHAALQTALDQADAVFDQIVDIEKHKMGDINYALEALRLDVKRYEMLGDTPAVAEQKVAAERAELEARYAVLQKELTSLYMAWKRDYLIMSLPHGLEKQLPLSEVVRLFAPNNMSLLDKVAHYGAKIGEFLSDEPREANTEGGVFPAIFGTVLMVLIMSIFVTPLGVVAAVYLREYAKQGFLTRLIRVAVNNLAGVPSIVYGVFGLGFFVYTLGGQLDALFYPERLPSPTFGTPGLIWAALTLALLTLPVVIVSTEEGLTRIPKSIREGSLALGATKAETLWRTVVPMASPAIMTGVILAVARAAGEVAPLMLVGVVKLAPTLPIDGNFPFLHLERKFMHLGFHIYDVGFQSPNIEAARPLVYATALLLILIILLLNMVAIMLRNRLRERYKSLEN